jgi:hypothetical protein
LGIIAGGRGIVVRVTVLLVSPIFLSVYLVPYGLLYRRAADFVEERVGRRSVYTCGYSFGIVESIVGGRSGYAIGRGVVDQGDLILGFQYRGVGGVTDGMSQRR